MNLDDIAVNFATQEKLEQIWSFHADSFIKEMKGNYLNRKKYESIMMNLLNLILLIIKRHNQAGQNCNFFLYLWRQSSTNPSIFDVFLYCDDWELSYRIIQILQDVKFEETIKYQIKQSIEQHTFEEQIHMGFYLFTNLVIAMTSQNHFHHKNRYVSLVEYQSNQVILFKKRDSQSFLVTNISNLKIEEGDIMFRFDVSSHSRQNNNVCLWQQFLSTIGNNLYLETNISQKQLEIFEAFIEFKYAMLCKDNFTQAAYFQIFYRRLASFASSNKLSILKNFCLQNMKREIHFNYVSRQSIQHFSLQLMRDLLDKMDGKGWILKRKQAASESEIQELQKDQLFRLAWDIVLFENGNVLHFLQEQYKIEGELFGRIEDFIFQYYLNTTRNAYIFWDNDMQYPNGVNVDTYSGFFQLFFTQFKTSFEKVIFSNEYCPKRQKMQEYENKIQNWQIQILSNIISSPEQFNGKQGIMSSIQFHELIRRYNEQFRVTITDKFKDLFIMILNKSIECNQTNALSDIFIHRMILICCSQLTDQKRLEILQSQGIEYFDKLFYRIIQEKNISSAFTFLMLLEQGSDIFRNQIIEFIVQSVKVPSYQMVDFKIEAYNHHEQQQDDQQVIEMQQNIDIPDSNETNLQQNENRNAIFSRIRKQLILTVAEHLVKDFGFCYDIFMSLSKTDSFILGSKQDIEKNGEMYGLYMKYYAQVYLNKGAIMMHSQFFNQASVRLQLRSDMLKRGVLESLIQRIKEDHEAEEQYYIKEISESERICRVAYRMMLNAKYTYLIHNAKQYIDSTMTLANSNAPLEDKKEIKADIVKHSFIVLNLILNINSIFTYSLSTSLSYLSNIRITLLRFVEIITQNTSEDIDFSLLFRSLFSGLQNNGKQNKSQTISTQSIDQTYLNELASTNFSFNKEDIMKLFQNFKQIARFYYNQDETILRLSTLQEVDNLKHARKVETIAFIIKKIIKTLNDSNKKAIISKYFTQFHIKNIQNSFIIGALTQRRYVDELFQLRWGDVIYQQSHKKQSKQIGLNQEIQNDNDNANEIHLKQHLIKQVTDEQIIIMLFKRIKCFINVTKFGLSLDVHGNSLEQIKAFIIFRDQIISSYNYVFFGSSNAPTFLKKKQQIKIQNKSKNLNEVKNNSTNISPKINAEIISNKVKKSSSQNKYYNNNINSSQSRGVISFLKRKSVTMSEKIVIHQLICMKYFNSLQKMLYYHIQPLTKVKTSKEKTVLFLESQRFIQSITHLFKHSMGHIKECKEKFLKNQNQNPIVSSGGAGGGASSSVSLSYLDASPYSKRSCVWMSNLVQLIFQEFAIFLTLRFNRVDNDDDEDEDEKSDSAGVLDSKKINQNMIDEKVPLLFDKSKSAGSLENCLDERRLVDLVVVSIQDETFSDEITLSQSSDSSQNIEFYDELTNQSDENGEINVFSHCGNDNQDANYFSSTSDCDIENLEDEYNYFNEDEDEEEEDFSNQNDSDNSLSNKNDNNQQISGESQVMTQQNNDQVSQIVNSIDHTVDLNCQQQIDDNILNDDDIDDEQYGDEDEEDYNQQNNKAISHSENKINQNQKNKSTESNSNNQVEQEKHLEDEKERIRVQELNEKQQAQKKLIEIKEKEIKKKQKYELYFIKLRFLISIIMKNLFYIESSDISQILSKISEKQIGLKIDKLKALQFFDTVFDSVQYFDLSEAISFKQFISKFYHPILSEDSSKLSQKPKSADFDLSAKQIEVQFIKKKEDENEEEEQKQEQNGQNYTMNQNKKYKESEKQIKQKTRQKQFNRIVEALDKKILKNKLTFYDITLLNSNQPEKVLQNSKRVLQYLKAELIPHILSIHQQIVEMISKQDDKQQERDNIEEKRIEELIKERRNQSTSVIVTLSVISYYLQFIVIKESEKQKLTSAFNIMSRSIFIFKQCLEIIKSESFYQNESIHYQQQAHKKISLIHQNIAQRYIQLSFQLILISRKESIQLFTQHNILSITQNLKMIQVDIYRNNISLIIYAIIYEIFNTLPIYHNTIEFSLKHYIFTTSKADYLAFSFQDKYSKALDVQSYQNEAKGIIMKGPKDFMKAFQKIISIYKLRKQKLKCYIKKRYMNNWRFPIHFDEYQIKVIEQLFEVCKGSDTEQQIYEGMIKQQKAQAGSNTYLTEEIETDCMNTFCFGKIILNLLQYYPCIVGLGDMNPKYHEILIDYMLQDSMGATKKLTKLYFTFYSLHVNKLDFLKEYWVKYSKQVDDCIPQWENSTKDLQKLFQSLQMIDTLQDASTHLKYEEGQGQMKHFLANVFAKIWDPRINEQNENIKSQSISQCDMYYFQNYLNIPSIYAAFYKNYIRNSLYTRGFEDIFSQPVIYDYVKELKYCLQMTSFDNYSKTLNTIFKSNVMQQKSPQSITNINCSDNQCSSRHDISSSELSHAIQQSQQQQQETITSEQNLIDEIIQVSQEFPFAQHDNDRESEIDQDIINEQVIALQQDEHSNEEIDETSIQEEQKHSINSSQQGVTHLNTSLNQQSQVDGQSNAAQENKEIKKDIKENTNSHTKKKDLFEGLKELTYGLKADGAIIQTGYIFLQGIKFCGQVENKLCNQQSLSQFMGRDIQIIINDATQYLMTNVYYKTKWKNTYNQFPLTYQNLNSSLLKYFAKLPVENSKFSLLKEVNRIALYQYQQIMLKIQLSRSIDSKLDKQSIQQVLTKINKQSAAAINADTNKSNEKKQTQSKESNVKKVNEQISPISSVLSKQQDGDNKLQSQQKLSSNDLAKNRAADIEDSDDDDEDVQNYLDLEILSEQDDQGLVYYFSRLPINEGKTVEQIEEIIQVKKREIQCMLKSVTDNTMRRKITIILARYFYYDIEYICQCIREALANNSCNFIKNLFEIFTSLNDDIHLQDEVITLHKISENNVNVIKTFIQLFNSYFPGQNLLKTLPAKEDPTSHFKVSLTGKEYNFLQNRNPYTIDKESKNKFDNEISNLVMEQKKKLDQLNNINSHKRGGEKFSNENQKQQLNECFATDDLHQRDLLLNGQSINIYISSSNQKYQTKLRKKYFDLIFDQQFEDSLIVFSHRMIDVALAMQDQLSSEDDYISSLQSIMDQYEFLLIFIHNYENRKYFMEQLKKRMDGLNQSDSTDPYQGDNQTQNNDQIYLFNDFQKRNFPVYELKTMLSNRYLMLLNILINNNEGIYELFLESNNDDDNNSRLISYNIDGLKKQGSSNDYNGDLKPENKNGGSTIQNFLRNMGRSEHIIKSIQHQKSIKSNFKQFVAFYTIWFDRSFQYFKESYEPFLTQQACEMRAKSLNSFILNEGFIKIYTTMLLNDLTSTNYKTKVNFHIERIIIGINKDIIFALIKEISHVLVEQVEPVVDKLLENIKRVYKQMRSEFHGNLQSIEKMDNNDRDIYFNQFQQQSTKYVENLHSKCDKQFYLIKYMNSVFKIMLEQHISRDYPQSFKSLLFQFLSPSKHDKSIPQLQDQMTSQLKDITQDNSMTHNAEVFNEQSNQIQTDVYIHRIIESLRNYEESVKERYEEILLDSGCFNLYSKILIFSKYQSISLQAGLIYNDRQSKYFGSYAYFSRSYQSLFYLYKIIHSNHHAQVDNIIKGANKNQVQVEECFSENSIDQNLPLLGALQNSSSMRMQQNQPDEEEEDGQDEEQIGEEERKDNNFTTLLQNNQYVEQMQQTVSSVSLQERDENNWNSLMNPQTMMSNINQDEKKIKKMNSNAFLMIQDQKSQKNLRTSHNLEDFDDEDLFGLNSMSAQELNLSYSLKYHELFKFFIKLENVIYFCIVRQPQDFAKIITQPLKEIQNGYSLYLKKMLIVSQTKFRVKKNINNNYTSSQSITIDRTKMIEESVPAVLAIKSEQLCLNTLYVKWKYESGIDEGGPRREWFSLIFNQLLDPNFGLFIQSSKNYTYMPNPFSFLVPDHLIYFKFLGILLGKAFLENYPVQANFAKPFLKLFLKKKIVISDLEEVDPELFKNLNWLLKNQINAEEMDINFIYDKFYAGQKYEIELKDQGKNILVNEENKKEYVKSICHAKLIREIYYQAQAITSGFREIVCEDLLQVLDEQMLSFVFSGNQDISVTELKETIQLQNCTKNDKQIKWLFEILESFNSYEKSCFIFFITGSMNLPHGGFKQFPITITMTQKIERLPVAHTCANSIDLPNYQTKERLEDALRKALFECQGFELA